MPGFSGPPHPPGSVINSEYVEERLLPASQGAQEQIFMAVHQGLSKGGGGARLGLAWYDYSSGEVGSSLHKEAFLIILAVKG
jgi:hypothetical protein